jgi:hypothetical protein
MFCVRLHRGVAVYILQFEHVLKEFFRGPADA